MAFSPRTAGDLLPIAQFQFTDDLNNIVSIAAGNPATNFTCILKPTPGVDQRGVARIVGAGTFAFVSDGSDGKINYNWVAGDVTTPGNYQVYCVAVLAGKTLTSDPIPLIINPTP
jgi:hypothetical protein